MPYRNGVEKPSEQLFELLSGKVSWPDAPEAVRSWAQLFIYQGAVQVLAIEGKGNRRNALGRIPAAVRPFIEAEALRLWRARSA